MVKIDTNRLRGIKLRPVAEGAFDQRSPPPRPEVNDIDVNLGVQGKAAMFGETKTFARKPPPQTIIREDKPSPRSSTGSNRSDSGVDVRDGRDLPPDPPAPREFLLPVMLSRIM